MTNQKTGWLTRLLGAQKKSGGCCSYSIEEIPEEGTENKAANKDEARPASGGCCSGNIQVLPEEAPTKGAAKKDLAKPERPSCCG